VVWVSILEAEALVRPGLLDRVIIFRAAVVVAGGGCLYRSCLGSGSLGLGQILLLYQA
jgi:hypothetical protein